MYDNFENDRVLLKHHDNQIYMYSILGWIFGASINLPNFSASILNICFIINLESGICRY